MDVLTAIKTRRSIRKYKDVPVPEDKLAQVLEAGRAAPSAGNRQPWRFLVVTDPETRKRLVPAARNQEFVGQAGAVIVACAPDPSLKWHMVDVAIALDHMTLAAHELGLGTCWVGAFEPDQVRQLLGIPEEVKVVALLPLGVPDMEGTPRPRKPAEEVFVFNRWA
ncbi:MAG: nitroreductase family protein [Bacillota bacterium]|nr:nitroreductase family protein [Bacillota bacterium]